MKNNRTRKLSQRVYYALIAGMAGAFLIPQVAFAAPTGEKVVSGGATVSRVGNDTNINSGNTNNVIEWRDYSLSSVERVVHDGGAKTNNYLNIVTGANTSNINGKIEGGNHVYIVNPNGVIFGKDAVVNVGHLHVSTQATSTVNTAADMANNVSPLNSSAGLSDVVNMGKDITANTVEVYGKNIRFLNAANVHTTASPVVLHTDTANGGYAHIGYKSGSMPTTTDYQVNGAAATAADNYYQLVSTKEELAAINDSTATLAGNYMLANDIDLENNPHTPLGKDATDSFKGKFDGNFFRIENINVSGVDNAGLFGVLNGASIYNVGVVGGSIASNTGSGNKYAGGIAAASTDSALYNVYVKDTKIDGKQYLHAGIVGHMSNSTIDGAYSKAKVGTNGAGIVGRAEPGTVIKNTYNTAVFSANENTHALFLGVATARNTVTIEDSYTSSKDISDNDNFIKAKFKNVFGASTTAGQMKHLNTLAETDAHASSTYTGWDINNDGAPGAKWRIYEGRTLPLLTAFMNGRVDSVGSVGANYSYRKFNQTDGSVVEDDANKITSNKHADVTGLTYDSKIVKIVDGAGNVGDTSNVTYDKTLGTTANIYTYTDTGSPQNKKDNIRNAGTKAILWSDQDGPNLRNVNVTIKQRKVSVEGSNLVATRRYNGTKDVTDAFVHAIQNGGITTGGFTPEDLADHSVEITVSTDFKAEMADKNAGDGKEVTFKGKLTFSGSDQSNYDIGDFDFTTSSNTAKGTANITKAPLILKVTKDSTTKVYDGTDAVTEAAMSADPNIKLDETLRRTGETDAADIKSDETHKKDDVSINYASIGSPTYINITTGAAEVHAGTHKIRYKNVELQGADKDNYELYYQMPDATQTAVTGNQIDLTGEITRRRITTNDFKVYEKGTNALVEATKTYDGNDEYAPTNVYLSTDENGTTGIVDRDKTHITFAMQDNKGHFIDNDTSKTQTKNVKQATRVAFTVTGAADRHTDTYGGHLISDYYVLDADGVTKNDLNVGFAATGAGRITPKLLTANVVKNHIEKTYDGWADQTDGNRTKTVGDPLVTLSGWVAGDTARTNTSTATYASPNVAWDDTNKREQAQNVTYNVSFARGSDADSDNYILDSSTSATDKYTLTLTQDGSGNNYTGTIKRREVALTMGPVDKIYDGTAANKKSDITSVAGKMGGTNDTAILNDDGITTAKLKTKHEQMMAAGTATSSFGRGTGAGFIENVNASNGTEHDVRYQNIDALFQVVVDAAKKNNYKVDDTVYGKGTINRRLIEKSGFQVRKSDGTIADATKVYDGTSTFALKNGETLVAKTAASGSDTGVVDKDKDNIYFTMTGENGHFTSDAAGAKRTSHKSEANYAAYSVIAKTKNEGVSPLSNYEFGTTASKRNLENVNAENPDAVTAKGSITPAKIQAQTKEISKVYDGMAEHTDGNRNVQHGDKIVGLNLIADTSGQPTNTSTAAYADKNVAYSGTNVTTKNVTYTAQLTGKYADDYEIVDAGNNVISSVNGTGDSKTVTATRNNVANMGTITPRTLNITMASVSKVYDTGSANTATNNTAVNPSGTVKSITDEPSSAVIGDILRGDGITKDDLGAAWRALRDHGDAVSDYGHKGNTPFEDENASAAPEGHDVRYTNMDTAFKNQYGLTTAGNYTVASNAYGKGTITPKALDPNKFSVEDANGHAVPASKTYDGTSDFTVDKDWKIRPSTGSGTGLFDRDANRVKFALSKNGAYFIDKNGNKTAHASNKGTAAETDMDAVKASYHVTASADPGYEKLLKNYTLNGKTLDSGEASVTGKGTIKRRELSLDLVRNSDINKTYDSTTKLVNGTKNWNALTDTDTNGNVKYVDGTTAAGKLVSGDGTSFHIESNYMSSAPVPAPDKNVRRDGTGQVISKDILYKITLNGDAANYSFNKGGTVTNAETGLELSAKGKIEPKDLSGAFKKVTKVYDGTTSVDHATNPTVTPAQVGFTAGAVIAGDTVNLATHDEAFQSKNVNGDGVNTWTPTEGTEKDKVQVQKNWINYSGLTLGGADAGNYRIERTAKGLGEITPLALDADKFKVDGTDATKAYDGTSAYQLGGKKLTPTGTGLIGTDADHIKFETEGDGKFTDNSGSETPNAYEATKVSYNVKAKADNGHERLLGNYTLNGKTLESNDPIAVSGKGTITRRVLRLDLAQDSGIDKVYDGKPTLDGAKWNELQTATNPAGNVKYAAGSTDKDKLVSGDGTSFHIESNYRNDDDTANDKKVKYNGSVVDEKKIRYEITITGGDARNYSFKKGSATPTDAEDGLTLSATGKITPKDLTGSFAKITKVYDGTTSVDHATNPTVTPAQVGFTVGTILPGDTVTPIVGHAAYQSANVNGDGSTQVISGTVQKNWINYSGLALTGADARNYRIDSTAKGLGEITPLAIDADKFKVNGADAAKVYDGSSAYHLEAGKKLAPHAGLIGTDANNIEFEMDGDGTFTDDNKAVKSNTFDATRVSYKVKAKTGIGNERLLGNYTLNGKTLDSGTIGVSGKGTITRRTLNLSLVQNSGIEKVYDGNSGLTGGGRNWNALTETEVNGNVAYTAGSQKLVNDGTGLAITSNYVEGASADRNVRRDGAGNVLNKDIRYDIAITGGDARNYFFEKNGVKTDAENGLTLTATGKITPKDLSGSFEKVRKTYDGTTAVAPNAVHFEKGAVIGDDDVDIQRTGTDAYTAEFESPNVDGSGTTWIAPDGTVQNNWVNYGNLKLTGAQAGNYQISPTARGLGEIIPLPPEPEFYIPDADYYNTLAANKMLPDEYAYENASLDRRSHFGRDAEAEIAYEPPSINIVQDGIDLSKSNIVVTDSAVFEIVNEVFG